MADMGKLHEAVRLGDISSVEGLIKNSDINGVYYGMTPLLVAITSGMYNKSKWSVCELY